MDIYKFFNVFHNPRLHCTPPRQQELSELELVVTELRKAVERIQLRTKRKSIGAILPDHFTDVLKALNFVESSLATLCDAHPGDSADTVQEMVQERATIRGWESWASLLSEQIELAKSSAQVQQDQEPIRKAS